MDKHTFLNKTLGRLDSFQRASSNSFNNILRHKRSRLEARKISTLHVKQNGKKVVDRNLKAEIKKYCKLRFGDSSYWPWLAVYSEISGKFKEGWIPYDWYRFQMLPKLNSGPRLSAFKTYDYQLFKDFSVKPYFLKISGSYYNPNLKKVQNEYVKKFFMDLNKEVVIKYDEGCGGKDVQFVQSSSFNPEDLKTVNNIILQPVVKQDPVLKKLNPFSVNTLRVMTHIQDNGNVVKIFAILRFGMAESRVDNASSGGGFVPFSDDGELTKYGYDINGLNLGEAHPKTGVKYNDVRIPSFRKAIKLCKEYHSKFPYQRLISWDICIDNKGEPKLIEWNTGNQFFNIPEALLGPFFPIE